MSQTIEPAAYKISEAAALFAAAQVRVEWDHRGIAPSLRECGRLGRWYYYVWAAAHRSKSIGICAGHAAILPTGGAA
jgi:hypothetical protein